MKTPNSKKTITENNNNNNNNNSKRKKKTVKNFTNTCYALFSTMP